MQHPVDLRPKTHVQHAIRFIQDEHAHVAQRDEPPFDQVLQTARRRNEDLRTAGTLRLRADRGPAVDRGDTQRAGRGERLDLLDDLGGELTRRHEDQRGRTPGRARYALDEGDPEGECLAGAGGRRHEDVDAAEGVRQDEVLHREWCSDAAALERAHDTCAHAERRERFLHVFTPCPARSR